VGRRGFKGRGWKWEYEVSMQVPPVLADQDCERVRIVTFQRTWQREAELLREAEQAARETALAGGCSEEDAEICAGAASATGAASRAIERNAILTSGMLNELCSKRPIAL
jgi:hypothetical protein